MSSSPSEETLYTGSWLTLKKKSLSVNNKNIKDYEYLELSASKAHIFPNGLSVVPIITSKKTEQKQLVIIANFRPPVSNYVLEFPGGLTEIDGGKEDAFRELKEETGFKAKNVLHDSLKFKSTYYDAWKSKESGKMIIVEIDGDEENFEGSQELDKDEVIKVFKVGLGHGLKKEVEEIAERNGFDISDQLYTFCLGLSLKLI